MPAPTVRDLPWNHQICCIFDNFSWAALRSVCYSRALWYFLVVSDHILMFHQTYRTLVGNARWADRLQEKYFHSSCDRNQSRPVQSLNQKTNVHTCNLQLFKAVNEGLMAQELTVLARVSRPGWLSRQVWKRHGGGGLLEGGWHFYIRVSHPPPSAQMMVWQNTRLPYRHLKWCFT